MDDQKKPEPVNGTNGQIAPNGFGGGSSFFDQTKEEDDEVFAEQSAPQESGAKNFFDNVTPDVHVGEVVSTPSEVKGEVSKEIHAGEESQATSEQAVAPLDEPSEGFFEKIQHLLTESGISMQTIRSYIIGCFVFVVVAFALIFGGMKGYGFLKQKFGELPATSKESQVSPEKNGDSTEPLFVFSESLESAILIGRESGSFRNFLDPSLFVSYELGEEALRFQKRFVQQVDFLNEMQRTVKTDLFRMLDQSRTREKTLSDYAEVLMQQENEGRKISAELSALISLMEVRFNNAVEAKALYETRFFESLKNLQGKESDAMLEGFIEVGRAATQAKAEFHALTKVKSYYEIVLKWVSTRRTTIELNKEALIKGVKVVGVEGSDLELVLTQESLSLGAEQ